MAIDLFLKLDGVEGEAQADGHRGEIQLDAFTWAFSNPSSATGAGAGAGRAEAHGFNCVKRADKSTPKLMKAVWTGQHFKKAQLTARKAGGKAIDYLKAEFDVLYITNFDQGASSGGDDIPRENLSFSFGKVAVTYTEQNQDGTAGGATVAGYDFKKQVEL